MDFDFLCNFVSALVRSSMFSGDDEIQIGAIERSRKRRRGTRGRSRTRRVNVNASFEDPIFASWDIYPGFRSWCWSTNSACPEFGDTGSLDLCKTEGKDTKKCTVVSLRPQTSISTPGESIKTKSPSYEKRDRQTSPLRRSTSRSTTLSSEQGKEERDDMQNAKVATTMEQSGVPVGLKELPQLSPERPRAQRQPRSNSSKRKKCRPRDRTRTPSWGALYQRMVRSGDASVEKKITSPSNLSRVGSATDAPVDDEEQVGDSNYKPGLPRTKPSFRSRHLSRHRREKSTDYHSITMQNS